MCVIPKGDKKCFCIGMVIVSLLLVASGVLYLLKSQLKDNQFYSITLCFALVLFWIFLYGYFRGYNTCNRIQRGAKLGAATVDWATSYQQDLLARQHGGVIYVGQTDQKQEKMLKVADEIRKDEWSGKLDAPN